MGGLVPQCDAASPAPVPQDYLDTVRLRKGSRFGENDIKSFVYHVFAMYDRHVHVGKLLPLFADQGLQMRFPDATLSSHEDFKRWYAGIGKSIKSNTHQVERLSVTLFGGGRYQADLIVLWRAEGRDGKFISMRVHQVWTMDDKAKGRWPRILSYIAEEAP
ncbi:MAG: hypothetical protein PHU21_06910 [Elusimicrobia bacterium]|nr:hypothetical protein [Elusimicrobiota bacterium]